MSPLALTFSSESADAASAIKVQPCEHLTPNMELGSEDVLVRYLAFPINPQDLMAIAGKYPVKPVYQHPDGSRIAGNDGIARIERVGSGVDLLQPGDLVLPRSHGLGTWRELAILPGKSVIKLPREADPIAGALLKMGFAPGYLLIEDTAVLKPGDWVVVNAGLGTIPQMAIQFARLRGCHAVAVVRERDAGDLEAAKRLLHAQGADVVVTGEDLAKHGPAADAALAAAVQGKRIVLALDAVFGDSAEHLARLLAPNATFVNYGSLGGGEGVLRLTQELLFWKQIKFRNFRLSQQLASRSNAEVEGLLAWFVDLLRQGRLRTPEVETIAWRGGDEAVGEFEARVRAALGKAVRRPLGLKKQVVVL
ncbi:uncharacterized protein MYCFIDRAFT_211068 [Pseudocercospora fijiensis CIRAD86]|uniref:enoyl-[acyl-carrier-protein] reductase n=1 Tax=Pseudocercospora fijiensis (strain CIRAD86) TaxID=383855 RepID=M3B7B2_PSEFD|nr:uncharacterized protein MYCFIDRAFT_211068 [Pseudocercospora fijiensis CIRAD86]EME85208.1 hypothetical protein MYCFIDRAFT_211068 [Pseudocercospora fijiensis CIRAD86]